MSSTRWGQNVPAMADYDESASSQLCRLETAERQRTGAPLASVRPVVARRIGILPGTAENIRRGRTKGVRRWIADRIRAAFIRELEREILGLQHELMVVRQSGSPSGDNEVLAVQTAIEKAQAMVGGLK